MLINTVILFLRDALPIFVLIVYLYEHLPANKLWLLKSVIAGALLSFLYINQINHFYEKKNIFHINHIDQF